MTKNTTQSNSSQLPKFPPQFVFGVATAAYQIEGAINEGGRGASIWDTFSNTPGKVLNGDTGEHACNHYHLWQSDLDLIKSLGVDVYRLSIAWPRLFPNGDLTLNQAGLDFYSQLIDGCIERGIKTNVTLYHWDLPQALADQGGWSNPKTAEHFAHYASVVAEKLGHKIDAISTFNEPWCSSILSHFHGVHAPGIQDLDTTLAVIHGQHRAHGLAVQAIRSQRPELPVGIVLNTMSVRPFTDSTADQQAAARHHNFNNRLFLDPLFKGEYPAEVMQALGDRMPQNWQLDLPTIQQPLDFWGVNYYTPEYVTDAADTTEPYPTTQRIDREGVLRTDIGWEIDATGLSDMLTALYEHYDLPPCLITENGAAFNQGIVDGAIDDQVRIDYLHAHIDAVSSLVANNIPIEGYFAWSLMDNFEWAEGYSMRFGLVHVDYQTQKRTLKNSAHWYKNLVIQHKKAR